MIKNSILRELLSFPEICGEIQPVAKFILVRISCYELTIDSHLANSKMKLALYSLKNTAFRVPIFHRVLQWAPSKSGKFKMANVIINYLYLSLK